MIATTRIDRRDERAPSSSVARLVDAEYLKLRKRRGLVTSALVLTVVPVTTVHVVLAILHWQDPHSTGPSGGVENFAGTVGALGLFSVVAAILVGATLGTGDLDAGVFRELVITGRSRRALFAARVPAGLALLLPIVGAGLVITAAASVGLAGSRDTTQSVMDPGMVLLGDVAPDATLILQAAGLARPRHHREHVARPRRLLAARVPRHVDRRAPRLVAGRHAAPARRAPDPQPTARRTARPPAARDPPRR